MHQQHLAAPCGQRRQLVGDLLLEGVAGIVQYIIAHPDLEDVAEQEQCLCRRLAQVVAQRLPGGTVLLQVQVGNAVNGVPAGFGQQQLGGGDRVRGGGRAHGLAGVG